ncbi:WbqC family protein [Myxococcus sp. XM-1-1-1]|uniref:WbqC family protein n=1 Tax=Myxococcus sp. XM-1-1-1 TaxID=2874602 RepID=UPI001CBB7E0B|nr:WbqC family protein [Myxococcus sp. XM-1-1-1]MBZ4410075.1 WbqC family protein [Myxococcus sp. XM-1-1-1]
MKVAVLQSNYLPWKGYFDIIHSVDLFVFYDDVQFTKNDWRHRNRIKTPRGPEWLSVPVGAHIHRRICDVTMTDPRWAERHFDILRQNYRTAPYWGRYGPVLRDALLGRAWSHLSELNQGLVCMLAGELGITTTFRDSRELCLEGYKGERLMSLLRQLGTTEYVSGPAARAYLDPADFERAGIRLSYFDYRGYPEYPQGFPPFVHEVSVVDLLLNVGPEAPRFIWGWRESSAPARG